MRKAMPMFAATVCAASLALALLVTCVGTEVRPANAAATATYTLTDLGTLGGATIARDINDSGQVVGQSQSAAGNRAFLYPDPDDGLGMKDLDKLPGGNASFARGINDSGQVVGFSRTSSAANPVHALLWEDGQMNDLGLLETKNPDGTTIKYTSSEAWHINDFGVAVGRAFISGSQGRAVLWEDGQIKDIGSSLKTPYSEAWGINNLGQVVGEAGSADQQAKAFLYEKDPDGTDKVTDIDAAGRQDPDHPVFPYPFSEAQAINDHGQVVGWSYRTTTNIPPSTPSGPEGKAFHYEKGADGTANVAPLNPLNGDLYSRARDIDESGRAVGWSRGIDGNERLQFSAVLWQDGQVTDLNDLIPANSRWRRIDEKTIKGWTLTDAYAINASGQIVGAGFKDGEDANLSQLRAFLLTPDTTEPKIECDTADGLWHDEDVRIPCTASDDGVGLADPADATFTLSTSVPAGTETADANTDSRQVCDAAGNCAIAGPIGGTKVDKKAPEISINTSPGGDEHKLGEDVTVNYDCPDGGSGTASCSGPVASGGKLDTASVGLHTFTVDAGDEVGNVASKSFYYNVIYDFDGFFSPIDNPDVLNRAKAGSAIPVKFSLDGDQGLDIFAEEGGSSFPRSGPIPCDSTDPVDAVEQTVSASSSGLTYDAATDLYTYVWKTRRDWTGCRQLVVRFDDGKEYTANFKFTR